MEKGVSEGENTLPCPRLLRLKEEKTTGKRMPEKEEIHFRKKGRATRPHLKAPTIA